jgi:hypothetical protein
MDTLLAADTEVYRASGRKSEKEGASFTCPMGIYWQQWIVVLRKR